MKRKRTILLWVLINGFGLGVGFVAYLQTGFLIDFGLDFDKHWQFGENPEPNSGLIALMTIPAMLIVAGMFFGASQACFLKHYRLRFISWIVATVIGFLLLSVLLMPLEATGILGNISGPVEPMMFTIGGCSLAGVCQYFLLKRHGVVVLKWLILWIIGLIVSIIPTFLIFYITGGLFKLSVIWPIEVFMNGFICAGFAAWMSGKSLFEKLDTRG